jgi:inosine-uridine nucleoside N-ribohydrolase
MKARRLWLILFSVFSLTTFLATAGLFAVQPAHAAGVSVIFDTDMYDDVDDVGALAILNELMLNGEANLLAVVVNTRSRYSAYCADAVNTYYGHPNVPIGITTPVTDDQGGFRPYVGTCAGFPNDLSAAGSIPTALNVYRQTLAAQPNNSVVIVAVGYLGRVSELLNSSPDGYSTLNGYNLISQKVKALHIMGGQYPNSGGGGEFNFAGDGAAAANIANNWPTKIVFNGFEIGVSVKTGHTLTGSTTTSNPVRKSYELYVGANTDRESWDNISAYYAVRPNTGLFTEVGNGSNAVNSSSGANTWVSSPVKNHVYLKLANGKTFSDVANALEPLMVYTPSSPTGTPNPNNGFVRGVNFNGNGVTIEGNTWLSYSAALSQGLSVSAANLATNTRTPNPAVDADTRAMLQSELWYPGNMALTQTLSNGAYNVYLWVLEDYQDNYHRFDVRLEGSQKGTVNTGVVGAWTKYGPYSTSITDGTLNIDLIRLSGDTLIQGLAIFNASGGNPTFQPPTNTPASGGTFTKGVNFNGNGMTIEGNTWLSYNAALSQGLSVSAANLATNTRTPNPAVDADTRAMLQSELWYPGNMNLTQTLPNGTYNVYLWVLEDYQDYYHRFDVRLEGTYKGTVNTGVVSAWTKYGPYNVTVSDGSLNIDLIRLSGDTLIQGLAIFRQ